MKKFGFLIFIIAILAGVVFANLFSFGRVAGNILDFSFVSKVKGSGVTGSEVRNIRDFRAIDVGGVFQVEIIVGKDFALEVEADDNLLQHIRTEVQNGVLKIETTESIKSQNPINIRVSAPDIASIEASGASRVTAEGLRNSSLAIDTSGASKISLNGETEALSVDVSGASNIDAESLKTQTAAVEASGASHVSLFVTGRLTSKASGASRIVYTGNPANVEKKTSGASSVRQK
jgi:predicted DNA binding CopG/RHH family protein